MKTVVIGIGLDNKFLSDDVAHLEHKKNIGVREIGRLMGRGKGFGNGPLPVFLRKAAEAAARGIDIACITVTWTGSNPGEISRQATSSNELRSLEVVDVLKPYLQLAEIVGPDEERSLWSQLQGAITSAAGVDPVLLNQNADTRFLVVGCHTEDRVLTLATFLRNVLGCPNVAISSHLSGSASIEAHSAALRHNLPACGVRVLLDLTETAEYAGLNPAELAFLEGTPCRIGPDDAVGAIETERLQIIERLCLNWSRVELRPLQGGFSGSLLFLADGWKGNAQIEPVVLKIDGFAQMRREINGYHLVKDLLGKCVPSFSHPVAIGDSVGVSMEFAAIEGRPETLQETFEKAETDESFRRFMDRLERALTLLSQRLYRNTRRTVAVTPYRVFGLDSDQQRAWLAENTERIADRLRDLGLGSAVEVDPDALLSMARLITQNADALLSEIGVVHGDLNFQNIVCDHSDNIWFIDWTHSSEAPIESDFAKLENDLKFVVSKQFNTEDLERLRRFEEFLLSERSLPDTGSLPDALRFVKWDLRYRKILDGVRLIRETCFDVKDVTDWLVYRVALLKHAAHTLSFDASLGRGECELMQLAHALYSVETLAFSLVGDDFHLQIRGERPPEYPPRCRVSIDYAPWSVPCPDYAPPYFDHLSATSPEASDSWAEPESVSNSGGPDRDESGRRIHRDDAGRRLNPRGRTGIAGRGLLRHWGPNPAVGAVALRIHPNNAGIDVLAGSKLDDTTLWSPKGFVEPGESENEALSRILVAETGWDAEGVTRESVSNGYFYDPRQTDHAWIEMNIFVLPLSFDSAPSRFTPGEAFEDVRWIRVDDDTIARLPAAEARCLNTAIKGLDLAPTETSTV